MPGEKLHQRARKKLSDGLSSWRKKRKSRAALSSASGDSTSPDTPGLAAAPAPSVLQQLACQGGFGSDEFLDGACSREADKSDSTTSPGSPSPSSPPFLSPGDGSLDGDHFINKLFSDIISTGDTSDADTDGERTLVGSDVASAHSLLSSDDVFCSPDEEREDGAAGPGGAMGFRHYCGAVGDLLGGMGLPSLSDSECSSDSTLLNLTLSSDEEDEPKKMLQIRVQGHPRVRKLSHIGKQRNLSHSDTAETNNGSENELSGNVMKAGTLSHGDCDVMKDQLSHGDIDVMKSQLSHGDIDGVKTDQLSHGGNVPNLLPIMRAMRTSSADVSTLSEIHSMLDLTCAADPSPLSHAALSLSMPELNVSTPNEKVPDRCNRKLPRSSRKHKKQTKSSTAFLSTRAPSEAVATSAGREKSPKAEGPPDLKAPPPLKISAVQEKFPAEVKRRCWTRSSWKALHITGIPEELCLCNCDNVCETDVEVKHVEITPDCLLSPDQVAQPINLLAVYKIKVSVSGD